MQDVLLFMQQHGMLSLAFGAVLILLVFLEFIKQKSGGAKLSPNGATQLINHDNATVVDLRSIDAYANGHIIDAVPLPYTDLEGNLKKLEKYKGQPIILVCAMGNESSRAQPLLQKNGFNAFILEGGIRAWTTEQLPLVKK